MFDANQKKYQTLLACQIWKTVDYVLLYICLGVMIDSKFLSWTGKNQKRNFQRQMFFKLLECYVGSFIIIIIIIIIILNMQCFRRIQPHCECLSG